MDRSEEVASKLDRVRGWLDEHDAEAVLFRSQANFAWLTAGGRSHVSIGEDAGIAWVLVTSSDAFVVTTNIERPRLLDEELRDLPYEVLSYPWHSPDEGVSLVEERAASVVADLPLASFHPAGASLVALRFTLLPSEVERYRALGRDAATALESAARAAEPGMSELEISGVLASECRARDILPLVDLVGADDRIDRYRHPIPTDRRVERTVMLAVTGRRAGLHASLTRFVSFGPVETDRETRVPSTARVDARYLTVSRPGTSLAEVFSAGMEQYAREGYPGEEERHHQGGLTGYGGREIFATPAARHVLAENQALAWNPSITGTKSEDTVLVRDGFPEILTRTGNWPELEAEFDGERIVRPAFLIR
ncbi:MAG: M24 family metallopeptidase [Actinomycetota bacterium]|jgi:Xaa-Pro aminopeptidase